MESDQERQVASFAAGLLLGAVIGAGVALLTAPAPGTKVRRRIQKGARRLARPQRTRSEAARASLDKLAAEFKERIDEAVDAARG